MIDASEIEEINNIAPPPKGYLRQGRSGPQADALTVRLRAMEVGEAFRINRDSRFIWSRIMYVRQKKEHATKKFRVQGPPGTGKCSVWRIK